MNTRPRQPREALNKAFLKVKVSRSDIEQFKANLVNLLEHINEKESEEFHKNLMADFLKNTYYNPNYFINTKERNDLVIHTQKDSKSSVGIILEVKKPKNKAEMVKFENLNAKALQELVLYFLKERINNKNLEVKYLIVTNIYDAQTFEKYFCENKPFIQQFEDFEAGRLTGKTTDFFYKEIAKPAIEKIKNELEFTYFNIQDYEAFVRDNNLENDEKLIALFKLLSPQHLLKLPIANDSNTLDKGFYSELLYLIGLTETKEKNKKLIKRQPEDKQIPGSLIENAILQLDSLDKISRLENPEKFGETASEQLFNIALELSITWMNRILLLKLLESQLITYHKGDHNFSFLNINKINSFDDLDRLFFQVLAVKSSERKSDLKGIFAQVPYLNSSLFEPTELEHQTIIISNLREEKLPIFSSTVLKDANGNKRTGELNTLQYLFEFLDAYDFSSEGSEGIQEEQKTLINASVLGLIFEKINGYKDGSYFTPGFITMYMCRETLRKAVIQKFNEIKGWSCQTLDDLYDKIEDRTEANQIINRLKICDPAVGSGHFLVSALNELIAIKHDLKILQDQDGRRLKEYQITVENDELIITDEDNQPFTYTPQNKESQRIQETLFHEKQTIFENCLFGVDINPNSVKICRLRLWIELLKNAYYKADTNYTELETLPNIDINIKCGNSLISRFPLDTDLKPALKKNKIDIETYQNAVKTYRHAENKQQKREMEKLMNTIKSNFKTTLQGTDPKKTKLRQLEGEIDKLENQLSLFEETKAEQKARDKKIVKLNNEIDKLRMEIEEIESGKIYENAFEWRFEFPEVLDDTGKFIGFDVVIGNPPYGVFSSKLELNILCNKYSEFGINKLLKDSYFIFCCLALKFILKPYGYLSYIIPNTWKLIDSGYDFRQALLNDFYFFGIDEFKEKIFDATVDCDIIFIQNSKNNQYFIKAKLNRVNLQPKVNFIKNDYLMNQHYFNFLLDEKELFILDIIRSKSYYVKDYFEIKNGVKPYEVGKGFPPQTEEILQQKPYTSETQLNSNFQPLIGGRSFHKYVNLWKGDFWIHYGEWLAAPREKSIFTANEKLIFRQTSDQIIGTIIEDGFIMRDNTHIILKKDEKFNLKYLLSILNSKLVDFFYTSINPEKGEALAQVKAFHLGLLPFYPLSIEAQIPFIKIVDQILTAKKSNPNADTTILEQQIDQLVYELYGFTEEEIKIVEGITD